jgi:NAD(P)-dependent dehydrogenase (short-subunit alcohol dehydrogenase family)
MNNPYQVLITGANRGIGLEFVKQYAADNWNVFACYREPQSSEDLFALSKTYQNIQVLQLDVSDFDAIEKLALKLKNQSIDLLINNAGIYPSSDLNDMDYDDWTTAFKINSMAPFKMTQSFIPHIAASRLKKIATLTSKMGSLDDNTSGGSYIYRTSKAALNMVMKSLSVDLKAHGISVVTLHPGWVLTSMGGPNALISTQTSVAGIRKVITNLNLSNTGKFIAYDGKEIAW